MVPPVGTKTKRKQTKRNKTNMNDINVASAIAAAPGEEETAQGNPTLVPVTEAGQEAAVVFEPYVRTNLQFGKPDEDSRGNSFFWAVGVQKEYMGLDGQPLVGPTGSLQIYSIPDEVFSKFDDGNLIGLIMTNVVLRSRAIGGLYDMVPVTAVAKLIEALGLNSVTDLPAPRYVLAAGFESNQDPAVRLQKRQATQMLKLSTAAASGDQQVSAAALLKLAQGSGSVAPQSAATISGILATIKQAQGVKS